MIVPAKHDYLPVANPQPSVWSQGISDGFASHRTTEDLPQHVDIAIIGGGYAGTATAWHLVKDRNPGKEKQSILILEARGACSGATGRNGGHMRPDLYGHIPKFIKRAGLEAGVEIAEFEIAHVQAIKKLVEEEAIDCDFVLTRSFDVWSNQEAADAIAAVYKDMSSRSLAYMQDVYFKTGVEAEKMSGVKGAKAAASYTAGSIWPYKFIAHLLKSLVASGDLNLQTYTPVTEVSPHVDGGFVVTTPRGTVRADKVVHANNAYVARLLPEYSSSIIPCKGICSHITVPKDADAPFLSNTYIERDSNKTMTYLIPRPDGSIVAGGAQTVFKPHLEQWYNNVDDGILIESAKQFYDGYMQRTFKGWEESGAKVNRIWTGVMGYSFDTTCHIGRVPDRSGQFIVAGFNGHGMPVVFLGAKGLAKMINEDATFEETGLPRLFKTTKERIVLAQSSKEEVGDIIGDGSLSQAGHDSNMPIR